MLQKKKEISVFAIFCLTNVFGQARKELNFGLVGINYEIPVHRDITIAPRVGTNLDLDWLNVGVKGNIILIMYLVLPMMPWMYMAVLMLDILSIWILSWNWINSKTVVITAYMKKTPENKKSFWT
ncbi:hypothetical protein [Flavobacterium sp. LAR06]|uniref:hypothetical protein n=1 Tax=Flavobacterium sp. LAR06 TaxID=3064897 RepID=UPI0035C12439